jgi:hypothetical protein
MTAAVNSVLQVGSTLWRFDLAWPVSPNPGDIIKATVLAGAIFDAVGNVMPPGDSGVLGMAN